MPHREPGKETKIRVFPLHKSLRKKRQWLSTLRTEAWLWSMCPSFLLGEWSPVSPGHWVSGWLTKDSVRDSLQPWVLLSPMGSSAFFLSKGSVWPLNPFPNRASPPKNISYSLWGSHPRELDVRAGPGGWGQGHRGECVTAEKGRWRLLPTWCLSEGRRALGKHQIRSKQSPDSLECANPVDRFEKRGFQKLTFSPKNMKWLCAIGKKKVANEEGFFPIFWSWRS